MTEKPATRASQAPHGPHTPPGGPGPHPAPADASQGRTALRDRIAEALYRHTMDHAAGRGARLLTRGETALWENSLARADAVLPVVETETAGLWDQINRDQHDAMAQAQRAEEAERQRDEALAALTTHAAKAHRRKWAHSEDNQAAFDALHRLGDDILASRDRLLAALKPKESR